ncbi:phosphotransferase enzyme family protein [Colletotrichum truncatum]|uniref:Phosphotransferase enzyme family protein n=1 Tax=Colletotrichum truncatum TaxID=5467 RepID=A0ACC3ZH52_COLTU|nr:phosphotransferase enzyme family protein [Colletotrichum truncatum]KAF6790576.1 phosphotransferase enzyme family protein [Colletotrichum truncatum]
MAMTTKSPIREDYVRQLTPYITFLSALSSAGSSASFKLVNFSDLESVRNLPGKTGARIVSLKSSFDLPSGPSRFVFKGIDYERYKKDGRDFREHQEKTLLHEIRILCTVPPHPNIMPRPKILVVVQDHDEKDHICGFMQPVMSKDSVDEQVMRANHKGARLPLALKAKWCYQMALAILHTHRVGKSYHMDLKPGNIVVDDEDNLRLVDWEQSGVSMFTHPPEVTIDQEAEESSTVFSKPGRRRIIYTPHVGAPRKNQKWGFPDWNVFPEWKRTCPRAAELAEVFSLGRTMWMLLEQVEQSADPTVWTAASKDIPRKWKVMVMRCIERDPNDRPELDEVVDFWRKQM